MTHEAPSGNEIGRVVASAAARRVIYGVYVVALLLAGATAAGFLAIGQHLPEWLVAGNAVLTFLGVPVGTLAAANTTKGQP